MICPTESKATEMLIDYCAGALDASRAASIEQHIKACRDCSAFVKGQSSAWKLLNEWDAPLVSLDFDATLYKRIEAEKKKSRWHRIWQNVKNPGGVGSQAWKPALPLAAAVVLVAGGFLLRGPMTPTTKPAQPVGIEATQGTAAAAPSVDVEKLERALEDLDMLAPMSKREHL